MKKTIKYCRIITLFVVLISCQTNNKEIKINGSIENFEVVRLDQVLSKNIDEIHKVYLNYPELYKNFFTNMIRAGKKEEILKSKLSKETTNKLQLFINDSIISDILKEIELEFPDFEYYNKEISKGLNRYESLFGFSYPKKEIGTFFSLFNADVHEFDSIIWIGLDMYLGPKNKITKLIPTESLPQYVKNKMDKKYIVSDVMFGYLMTHNPQYMGDDFLSKLLSYGKTAYLMNLLLPDEDPENKFRYNKSELKWCEENEKYIWQYIIDQEILYEKDFNKISYFFNPGPYTKNFGKDSPAYIGIWLGYRIIQDYAKKTNLDINEILNEKNSQKILSTYEPE